MGRLAFQTSKAFWLKQGSAGLSVGSLLFLGSVAFGKLMMKFFATQVFQPDTPDKESSLKLLYANPDVKRGLATLIIGFENVILAALNFMLNLNIVTAAFGTEQFNSQVAEVNAITRILFTVVSFGLFAVAFYLTNRAIFKVLPEKEGNSQFESVFWNSIGLWQKNGYSRTASRPAEQGSA
jgi:hypothetical protein